jgi:hypothetical protein
LSLHKGHEFPEALFGSRGKGSIDDSILIAIVKVGRESCHAGPVGVEKVLELAEQGLQQRLSRDVQVLGHVSEDSAQCADPQRLVMGNRDVVLAASSGGQAHMAAGLARYLIGVTPKQDSQFFTTEVAW